MAEENEARRKREAQAKVVLAEVKLKARVPFRATFLRESPF